MCVSHLLIDLKIDELPSKNREINLSKIITENIFENSNESVTPLHVT